MNTVPTADTITQLLGAEMRPDVVPEDSTGRGRTLLPDVWPGTSSRVVVVWPRSAEGPRTFTEVGDLSAATSTWWNHTLTEDGHQTNIAATNTPVMVLEESARMGDRRTFAALARAIDWSTRRPDELTATIDLALSLEMATLAIDLAQLGGRLFPDHERVQRAAQVLAPPVVRVVRLPRARGLDASRKWLREHASQYRGQWVAVREGQLLGAAESLGELKAVIGEGEDAVSTIVTRVL
jgi:hypothetical protein